MKPATVAIAFLEYEDVPNKGKRRPVLILKEDEEMISVFKISTKYGNKPSYFRSKYFKIQDLSDAGLSQVSYIDTSHVRYLYKNKESGLKVIGHLSSRDVSRLTQFIHGNLE